MPTDRTVYKYHFKLGNKIVHTGITSNIDFCAAEHRRKRGWGKGHIKQVGYRTTYQDAIEWEQEQAARGKPVREEVRRF